MTMHFKPSGKYFAIYCEECGVPIVFASFPVQSKFLTDGKLIVTCAHGHKNVVEPNEVVRVRVEKLKQV